MSTHEAELRDLKKGFRQLVSNIHQQKLDAVSKDLDEKIQQRLLSIPAADTIVAFEQKVSTLIKERASMEKRIAQLETAKGSAHSTTLEKKITSLEKRFPYNDIALLKRDVALLKQRQGDLKIAVIEKKITALEKTSRRLASVDQEIREADIPRRIDDVEDAVAEKERILEARLASLDKKIGVVQLSAKKPVHHQKNQSLAPLANRITSLENRLERVSQSQAAARDVQRVQTKVLAFQGKLDALEMSEHKLRGLHAKLEETASAEEEEIRSLAKEQGDRVADSEQRMTRMIGGIQSRLTHVGKEHEKRLLEFGQEIDEKITRREAEMIHEKISTITSLMNKKLNEKFITWLDGLEQRVNERFEKNIDIIERTREQFDLLRKDIVMKKDIEELEEQMVAPLKDLDRKIKQFVKKEVDTLHHDIVREQKRGGIDHKTLQKEIDAIVRNIERQRTRSLEEELGKIVADDERLKKKRVQV